MSNNNSNTSGNGEVCAVLLQDKSGRYFWAVVFTGPDGIPEIVEENLPDAHEAKDAAWRYAQSYGATLTYHRLNGERS